MYGRARCASLLNVNRSCPLASGLCLRRLARDRRPYRPTTSTLSCIHGRQGEWRPHGTGVSSEKAGDSRPGTFAQPGDVVRGEIQGAVSGVTDRVAALERGLQVHNDRTFQAVETLSATQAQQSCRIEELAGDTRDIAHRLTFLEGSVKNLQSVGSTPSTAESGRVPALVMGGWPPDTMANEVLQKANEMARDLQLQLNMADAFVPGVRRGFVLIPISANQDESDESMRQRIQACIRRVNSSNVTLGRKPDGNPAKLWLSISQPPERRRRAALAGKVKRLIIEAGGLPLHHRIEPEWATGTVWFKNVKVSSGSTAGPAGSTPAGCGWIDLPAIATQLGIDQPTVESTWAPLLAALR